MKKDAKKTASAPKSQRKNPFKMSADDLKLVHGGQGIISTATFGGHDVK